MTKNKLDLIFKSYDIRGVYGDSIDQDIAYKIGKAFAEFVPDDTIIVGHDGRVSNIEMLDAFTSGIKSINKEIIYVGLVPTDTVYSLSGLLKKPGAIITASHNPKNYNGLKLCNAGAIPIGENSGLMDIKKLADRNVEIRIEKFKINDKYLGNEYYEHLKNLVSPESISQKLNFGIDGGNGVFGAVFDTLNNIYKFNVKSIYLEVDGNFPNHPADPSDESNLTDLKNLVLENDLDFGIAFDGDADRGVFIDNLGRVISGSMMTVLISEFLSSQKNEFRVVHNVNVSPHALKMMKNNNIELYKCKVGHSNIKKMMRDVDADFGGEHSAHFYYRDNFYADSAILTLLIFMKLLSSNKEKLSSIIDNYNFPPSSGEINFSVEDINESISKIESIFEGEFDQTDGLSCLHRNFWFNVRGSNTENKLRINVEADTQEILDQVLEKISSSI